jgi:hypothetical protein
MLFNYCLISGRCAECNGEAYDEYKCPEHCLNEMIDPDEALARFIVNCLDPVPHEEEKYPYDDLTYPIPMPEDQYFDEE